MKKYFALAVIFTLIFTSCEQPTDEDTVAKLPNLTIKNESSFILTNVTFSGISFATSGNDLPVSEQSVKQLKKEDLNKPGYITFTRKDIGIICRVPITIANEDRTFIFLDTTIVEEQANSSNTNTLAQITFLSKVTIELGGLTVPRNDIVDIEWFVNFTKQTEFTLKNTGVGKLLLTGTQPVKITGTGADAFSVVQPASSEIAPNGSLTYKINFTPGAVQNYNATVTISSNDQGGDFIFTIRAKGVPPKPIATVFYGDNEISQDGTIDAGIVVITHSKNIAVEIKNTGTEVLALDTANISISGANAAAFSKLTNPSGNISIGSQTSFIIECKPTEQGENNAVLVIPTNDTSRNPVIIYLRMTAAKGSAVLQLSQGTTVIANNSLTPFDFGRVALESNKPLLFTIKNTGNIDLELTGNPAAVSSNALFEIQTQPANKIISPGTEALFLLAYIPTTEEEDYAAVTILNDSDDMVFTLNVKGTGYIKRSQITVKQGTTTISPNGEYGFGSIYYGATKSLAFIIENSGEAVLTFSMVDGNCIRLENNTGGHFSVSQQPLVMTITPGNSTTFTILFYPAALGSYNATVKIITDSQYDDEFSFRVTGDGRNYATGDTGPGGGIIFYVAGNEYKECSEDLGQYSWNDAVTVATNHIGGGFTDWHLPDRGELALINQNIKLKNLGGFISGNAYTLWSSVEINYSSVYGYFFYSDGGTMYYLRSKGEMYTVRAIRAFSL